MYAEEMLSRACAPLVCPYTSALMPYDGKNLNDLNIGSAGLAELMRTAMHMHACIDGSCYE